MTPDVPTPGEPVKPSGWFQLDLDALKQRYLDCWEDNNPRFDCLPRDIFDFLGFDVANLLAEVARLTAERDRLQAQVERVRALCDLADSMNMQEIPVQKIRRALGADPAPQDGATSKRGYWPAEDVLGSPVAEPAPAPAEPPSGFSSNVLFHDDGKLHVIPAPAPGGDDT